MQILTAYCFLGKICLVNYKNMRRRLFIICTFCLVIFVISGCGKRGIPENSQISEPTQKQEEKKDPGSISHLVDFPIVEFPKARQGDYVLCPIEAAVDNKIGAKVYYGATLEERAKDASKVKRLSGGIETIPNSLILPIRPGERASVGDIILTWWQTGSGMQRAIVVGGEQTEPAVMYLDIAYDNPSGAGRNEDILAPDTFQILDDNDIGTAAACIDGDENILIKVVGLADGKLLGLGFADELVSYDSEKCQFIPIKPDVKQDDEVFVPIAGSFLPATVDSVDPKIGRVFVSYEFAGQTEQAAIAFGNVLTELK